MTDRIHSRPTESFGSQVPRTDQVLVRQNSARSLAESAGKYGDRVMLVVVGIALLASAVCVGAPALAEQFGR